MRLTATASERRLQEEIRAFLVAEHADATRLPRSLDERMEILRAWQARCYDAGYVGRAWPREFGGGGGPAAEQIVIDQELAAAGAPEFVNIVGLDVLGPSLLGFGTDVQRRRHIPAILRRGDLVPGLLRAGRRIRPRVAAHARRRARRALRPQRPEDVGVLGPVRALVRRAGAHGRECSRPSRHLHADRRHALPGHRAAAHDADHRARGVLRAVPRRRRRAGGEPPRRARRRLEDRHAHARPRARDRRPPASGQAAHVARPRRTRRWRARARRRAADRGSPGPGRARAGADRDRGAAPPRLPDRRGVPQRRGRRPRQLERQAADGRGRAAPRHHRPEVLGETLQHAEPAAVAENAFWYETYLYSRAASVYGGTQQIQRNIIADRVLGLPRK